MDSLSLCVRVYEGEKWPTRLADLPALVSSFGSVQEDRESWKGMGGGFAGGFHLGYTWAAWMEFGVGVT